MVTRTSKPSVDTRGLQGPQLDTFRALNVPFKGTPRVTGVGDNYRRLAESLGAFSNSLDSLGSVAAQFEKKSKQDALDAEIQADIMVRQRNASGRDTVNYVAETGINPTGDTFTNITKLNGEILPNYSKQADDWRKSQEENPDGWTTPTLDEEGQPITGEDGNPTTRRLTREDINLKWDQFTVEATKQYSESNVYKPQFKAILGFADEQRKKDLAALDTATEKYVVNQGLTAASNNAPTIFQGLGASPDVSAQSLADGLSSNMNRIATEASGNTVVLDGKQRLQIFKQGLQSITEAARTDTTQAYLLEMMLRDGRLPTGALIKTHPELQSEAEAALRVSNETLLKQQHDETIAKANSVLDQSKLPLHLAIQDDLVDKRVGALGEEKTLKTSREDLVKDWVAAKDRQIEIDGAQVGREPESIILDKIRAASTRGYVSPSIKAFFEADVFNPGAPLDNTAQDHLATALSTYQLLKRTAPMSVGDYVKDAKSRNYLAALDLMSRNAKGKVDTASLSTQLQANLDDEGKPLNAIGQVRDDYKSWNQTDKARALSAKDHEAVTTIFNLTYGSERNLTDVSTKLDAIADIVNEGSYQLNGSAIPLPDNLPAGVTREKFAGQTNEYVGDVLKQYAPEYKLKHVKAYPVYGGTSFMLKSIADGRTITKRNDGNPIVINFNDVTKYLDKKLEPFRAAEQQERANSLHDLKAKEDAAASPFYTLRGGKRVMKKPSSGLLILHGKSVKDLGSSLTPPSTPKEDKPQEYRGRGSKPAPRYGKGGPRN